jgi:hypothetical protein
MTRAAHVAPEIDLVVNSALWNAPEAEVTVRRAVVEAADALSTKSA